MEVAILFPNAVVSISPTPMPGLLLTTKLQVPQVRLERVTRPRLVARLQQGLRQKLILVSAPAGYGKTTLLAEWLETCGLQSAWISLDKGDNEPARFWTYVEAAVQRAMSSIEAPLSDLSYEHGLPASEALLTDLVNEIADLPEPLILVLDDYHNIESQCIHNGISFLLDQAPTHFHLILSTRSDPPLPLASLRAHSQMLEIRLADLRFTTQEITEFLRTVMSLDISDADVSSLESSTEGWAAGLQMAGLSLQGKLDASAFIRSFSGENRYVLDFLFEEVFQRQPPDVQNFLLCTSILGQLCGSLCDAINLGNDGQAMLGFLERHNLFLIALDDRREWYRYHHLFSDLLQSRLRQALPSEIAPLHQRASAWYAASNNLESAIAHALAAQDFECAAGLIELVIEKEEVLNHLVPLRSWMERLPAGTLHSHPWLCVYRAWVDFETGQRESLEDQLQRVEDALDAADPDRRQIQGHLAALRAYVAFTREDIPGVLEMGQTALDLLPADDRMRSSAAVVLGAGYWAVGDVVRSERTFRVAREAALKSSFPRATPATCYIGLQQLKQGRLHDAVDTFQDGLRLASLTNGYETFLAGFPNVRLGDVYREWNDLQLADQYLTSGLAQCQRLAQVDVLVDAYVCLGRLQLASGDLDGTHDTLQTADRLVERSKVDQWVLCWLDDLRLRLWLTKGDLDQAGRWAANSGLAPQDPLSYQHDLHHQNLARVLVAQGRLAGSKRSLDEASVLLARLQTAAKQAGWVHEQIRILVLQAIHDQVRHQGDAALKSLAGAVSLAESGGYVRVFMDEGTWMRELLVRLGKTLRDEKRAARDLLDGCLETRQLAAIQRYIARLVSLFEDSRARPDPSETRQSSRDLIEPLSGRETDVLRFLAQGCADKQIAEKLVIAPETVHKHLKNMYGKLGVHSRTEAIARAHELGLL